jgi:hypothetical protein
LIYEDSWSSKLNFNQRAVHVFKNVHYDDGDDLK